MTRPKSICSYILNILVGIDQLGNALAWGDPHASISSRAYLGTLKAKPWACILCRWLDQIQKDHCKVAWEAEMAADQARIFAEELIITEKTSLPQ